MNKEINDKEISYKSNCGKCFSCEESIRNTDYMECKNCKLKLHLTCFEVFKKSFIDKGLGALQCPNCNGKKFIKQVCANKPKPQTVLEPSTKPLFILKKSFNPSKSFSKFKKNCKSCTISGGKSKKRNKKNYTRNNKKK